jgi:hypothetical protein
MRVAHHEAEPDARGENTALHNAHFLNSSHNDHSKTFSIRAGVSLQTCERALRTYVSGRPSHKMPSGDLLEPQLALVPGTPPIAWSASKNADDMPAG